MLLTYFTDENGLPQCKDEKGNLYNPTKTNLYTYEEVGVGLYKKIPNIMDPKGYHIPRSGLVDKTYSSMNFMHYNFANEDLKGFTFLNCYLFGADFKNCDLRTTKFINCDLEKANFSGAWLDGENFENSPMPNSKLNRAFSPGDK